MRVRSGSAFWRRVRPGDRRGRRIALAAAAALVLVAALALWVLWPYARALGRIGADADRAPSRLYARPEVLHVGERLAPARTGADVEAAGYRPVDDGAEDIAPGRYRLGGGRFAVRLRHRRTPRGEAGSELVEVFFADGRVTRLRVDGREVRRAELEAPLLASYYGEQVREVWPAPVGELPPHVVRAVLAAEDAGFYRHLGMSITGTLRAAWVNLRSGEIEQGGSTLTQQLVKNVFLSPERSLVRKAREAALAIVVDLFHSKREILQAYLDRIYLGTGGGVNYHGIGAAARAYFSKDPRELTVAEAATLAGMIRAPAHLSPVDHPEAARERRDEVLARMEELGWLSRDELAAARAEPLSTSTSELGRRRAPHFAVAAAAEARERFGVRRLGDRGYTLFATLSAGEQELAQRAVREGTAALGGGLEGALVSVEPHTGAVRAWVGGRDFRDSQFDRVRQARRQAGSAAKPIVLAAALASGAVSPASRLEDAPLALETGGRTWRPRNADGRFRGPVTVRTAVEQSLNVPMVRLAMTVGLDEVAAAARALGVAGEVPELPSSALGAFEVSPYEMAGTYATFAAGGRRPAIHGLRAVFDARGRRLGDGTPPRPEQVLDPAVAYVVTSVLEGVVARGTGRGARRFQPAGPLAAKTGTSNRARDCWFAAYTPERVTVVWVGRDDFEPTGGSGARAALPVWGRYTAAATPPRRQDAFRVPPGIERRTVCTTSGRLPNRWCPTRLDEVFLRGQAPEGSCDLHRAPARPRRPPDPGPRVRRWLRGVLDDIFG